MYSLRNWGRYAHLSENILYVDQEGCHVASLQVPDVPDSEARGISHFPRVDDLVWKKRFRQRRVQVELLTSFPETCVKGLKVEVWMVGVVETGDYVARLQK